MAEAIADGVDGPVRALARLAEPLHAVTYYSQEMLDLTGEGYKGWWHAYFAYRPAPMGAVGAATVTAAFYNFAPRMVARAVPGVWDIRSPEDTTELRRTRVVAALERIFDPASSPIDRDALAEGAAAMRSFADVSPAGRPVFAAYAAQPWPDDDLVALWHGATLYREHRGDSHNIALASAGIDGVECHVLMAGRGHGNAPTIQAIRGWTDDEWSAAVERLAGRGWVAGDGSLTDTGRDARSAVEQRTDELTAPLIASLGDGGVDRLAAALGPLVEHLVATGEVSRRWPPEHLLKPAR